MGGEAAAFDELFTMCIHTGVRRLFQARAQDRHLRHEGPACQGAARQFPASQRCHWLSLALAKAHMRGRGQRAIAIRPTRRPGGFAPSADTQPTPPPPHTHTHMYILLRTLPLRSAPLSVV